VRVAVLGGGRSSEHEISLQSAASVSRGLAAAGHETIGVLVDRDGRWWHDEQPVSVEPGRGLLGADAAFPALHGPYGEDGTVQGLLEIADVPYVGAGVAASALCMNKVVFKDLMAHAGIPQVDYVGLRDGDGPDGVARLGLPVFVKPARLGSSVGISRVESADALEPALRGAFGHDPVAIVEAAAAGIEVECGVIGNSQPEASQPGLIETPDWYDFDAKYTPGGMDLTIPAPLKHGVSDRVRELAVEAFTKAGCSGLARVDFFVVGDDVLVNELNTMPGFTETSVFPKLWEASGVAYPELLDRLVTLAVERYEQERRYSF
jgi:D-alanine-D-alanine ligase